MKNLIDKYIIEEADNSFRNCYKVQVKCDAGDADYMKDTLYYTYEEFSNDTLLQYVITYLGKGYSQDWNDAVYGHYIAENRHFKWLEDYCLENGLLLVAGMIDSVCHSICEIKLSYIDSNNIEYKIKIPDINSLFESEEEMVNEINELYHSFIEHDC